MRHVSARPLRIRGVRVFNTHEVPLESGLRDRKDPLRLLVSSTPQATTPYDHLCGLSGRLTFEIGDTFNSVWKDTEKVSLQETQISAAHQKRHRCAETGGFRDWAMRQKLAVGPSSPQGLAQRADCSNPLFTLSRSFCPIPK